MTVNNFIQELDRVKREFVDHCKNYAYVSDSDINGVDFEPSDGYFVLRIECVASDDVFTQEFEYNDERVDALNFFWNDVLY